MVVGGDFAAYWNSTGTDLAKAGMRAGLFHPTTGYSLPDADPAGLRRSPRPGDLSHAALVGLTHDHAAEAWAGRGFYRALDTMLFRAAEPAAAVQGAGTLLPAGPGAGAAVLRGGVDLVGSAPHPGRAPAGADRPGLRLPGRAEDATDLARL